MTTPSEHVQQIITDYLYDGDQAAAEKDARIIVETLKYQGFIVVKADTLVKNIGEALVGA